VYAFDQFTLGPLNSVTPFHPGTSKHPPVHIFLRDPLYEWPAASHDRIDLYTTLGKLLEVFVLQKMNAGMLYWVTGLNWFYFFVSARLLLYMQLSRGYGRDLDNSGRLDIMAGKLPSTRHPGGACRILLSAPGNFRQHVLWKIVWALGAVISIVSIVSCFVLLASCPPRVVYTWVGFQVLWLLCRSLFFHFAEGTDSFSGPTVLEIGWGELSPGLKRRVLELVLALCQYQTHVHPRERKSYLEDTMDLCEIQSLFTRCTIVDEYPLAVLPAHPANVDVNIIAIMGDTLLSSIAWFYGSKYTSMDLYDCCIIFLEVPSTTSANTILAVPAVRTLCASLRGPIPTPVGDVESASTALDLDPLELRQHHSPKGSPAGPGDVEWFSWIPCSDRRWLQVRSSSLRMLGSKRRAEVLSGEELAVVLQGASLEIDSDEKGVCEVMARSRAAAQIVMDLIKGSQSL